MKGTEKKREIRHKAIALFKEKGFENVTVIEIAKASNISKNTFYYYFDSKDDIIKAQFDPTKVDINVLKEKTDTFLTCKEKILFLFTSICDYYEEIGEEVVKRALFLNLTEQLINTRIGKDRHPFFYFLEEICKEMNEKELASTLQCLFFGCLYIWATASTKRSLKTMVLPKMECVLKNYTSNV